MSTPSKKPTQKPQAIFRAIGPAVIVAAVVCGPGSILLSSQTGARFGYSAAWILVVACLLMMGMVALATRIGMSLDRTPCGELADRLGRPVAALVGIVMFLIVACFQFSNNTAIIAALETFGIETDRWQSVTVLFVANAIVLAFLYGSRQLYGAIERVMKALVLMMIVAFLINCVVARPSVIGIAKGLVPAIPKMSEPDTEVWILVGLIGTTFSVAAAFYQAYLVREKGWKDSDAAASLRDTLIGIGALGAITLVIMVTSAAVFQSYRTAFELKGVQDVALQLKPFFGVWAQVVFGIGIFAGAISSFLVNALIGGHVLADGFGLGDRVNSRWTQHFTACALIVGMIVGVLAKGTGMSTLQIITFAQALTVVGVPALALALIYLGLLTRFRKRSAISWLTLVIAGAGFLVTILLATRTVLNIVDKLSQS